ncbi:DUF4269 domain-containing protein [Hymenobacter metallicola]|nr:DUF4269 domain-containing protein [Hymenobacter metallicola]
MPDWRDLTYLQTGTTRQQQAFRAIARLGIVSTLQNYTPILAGTIPLAIDLPGSDLDIICEVPPAALPEYRQLLQRHYGHFPDFALTETTLQEFPTIVCSFRAEGFIWEVFGQPQASVLQNAVRHLIVEHAVLEAGGQAWRTAVRQLKQAGLKTEPAFAQLLRLPGDPYAALLTLEGKTPRELQALLPDLRSAESPGARQ